MVIGLQNFNYLSLSVISVMNDLQATLRTKNMVMSADESRLT